MERYYHRDLCDVWRGRLTLRKVRVLIDGLPMDSRTASALAGVSGPMAEWSLRDLLLGYMADEMARYRWQWEQAHRDPKAVGKQRDVPKSVLPQPEPMKAKASEVAHRDDIPIVSPHRLGGFVNGDDN